MFENLHNFIKDKPEKEGGTEKILGYDAARKDANNRHKIKRRRRFV